MSTAGRAARAFGVPGHGPKHAPKGFAEGGQFIGRQSLLHKVIEKLLGLDRPKGAQPDVRRSTGRFTAAGGSVVHVALPRRRPRIDDRVRDPGSGRLGTVQTAHPDGTGRVAWDDGRVESRRLDELQHPGGDRELPDPGRSFDLQRGPEPGRMDTAVEQGGRVDPAAAREVEVENRIRAAYREVAARPFTPESAVDLRQSGWVRMADLREHPDIAALPRAEQDQLLKRMVIGDGAAGHAIPESAQWLLRPEDRAAALPMGGQQKHWLKLDDPSPRPMPSPQPAKRTAVERMRDMTSAGRVDSDTAARLMRGESPESIVDPRSPEAFREKQHSLLNPADRALVDALPEDQRELYWMRRAAYQNHEAAMEGLPGANKPTPRRPDPDDPMGLRILARGGFRDDGPLSAADSSGRPTALPSKEERDRRILGDAEYERRQTAVKVSGSPAVRKMAAAKAPKVAPPSASEARAQLDTMPSEDAARAYITGLGLDAAGLKALAADLDVPLARRTKAGIVDDIVKVRVSGRMATEVLQRLPALGGAPSPAVAKMAKAAAPKARGGYANPAEARQRLMAATSVDEGWAYLNDLDLNPTQARRLAADLGVRGTGRMSRDEVNGRIVDTFVGSRMNSNALSDPQSYASFAPPPRKTAAQKMAGPKAAKLPAEQFGALALIEQHGVMAGYPRTLDALERKGLIHRDGNSVTLTDAGRSALRTATPPFDPASVAERLNSVPFVRGDVSSVEAGVRPILAEVKTLADLRKVGKQFGIEQPRHWTGRPFAQGSSFDVVKMTADEFREYLIAQLADAKANPRHAWR